MKKTLLALSIALSVAVPVFADDFAMGPETGGLKVKLSDDADFKLRIRLQPRIDTGDIIKSSDGKSYDSTTDMYIRRIRLETNGKLSKNLKWEFVVTADKWDKDANTNEFGVQYANVEYEVNDALSIMAGKSKLPYSRVSLTSSSKQLILERPTSTEDAKKFFGKTEAYYQPKVAVKGKLAEGVVAYEVAVADGWQNGEVIKTGTTTSTANLTTGVVTTTSTDVKVQKSNPVYMGRVELSPPGWVESGKSDAWLGKGQHLTLAFDYAAENSIEYVGSSTKEDRTLFGGDISAHMGGLTLQGEYNSWKKTVTGASDVTPNGWYTQAGYFIAGANIEPVARYEVYDKDSNKADMKQTNTIIGANWYGQGHSFKLGVNWVHSAFEKSAQEVTNKDSKDIYQIQAQMYF